MKSFFKSMNSKKKKNLVAALMVAMSVVSFSGCSAGSADNTAVDSSAAAVHIHVRPAGLWFLYLNCSNPARWLITE